MDKSEVVAHLKEYLETNVLKDNTTELAADTPLLKWGVLTSLTMAQLVSHIREHFGIFVPAEQMVGAHFKDLDSIADLLVTLDGDACART